MSVASADQAGEHAARARQNALGSATPASITVIAETAIASD
jgi:hypothetical protein